MERTPSLLLIEPTARQKRYRLAKVVDKGAAEFNADEIKRRLKQVRSYSAEHMVALTESFRRNVGRHQPASIAVADDAVQVVDEVSRIMQDAKTIAVGKSATVGELRPGLEKSGYRFIDTYTPQFSGDGDDTKKINHPWQLPETADWSRWDTFGAANAPSRQILPDRHLKDITGLLGVNAASAEDGSLFFLQHSSNIGNLLRQAGRLILVIGLEKIVQSRADALFQTQCIGTFGMESVLLDLKVGDAQQEMIDPLADFPEIAGSERQLHIILLDNGRTRVAEGDYRDLLRCIGCKACSIHCACYRHLDRFDRFPQDYLWSNINGANPSVELCSHCAMCAIACPVDIPLPNLLTLAKTECMSNVSRKMDNQMLIHMTTAARFMGPVAPLVNRLAGRRWLRWPMEKMTGIDSRRKPPAFSPETFEQWFRSRNG